MNDIRSNADDFADWDIQPVEKPSTREMIREFSRAFKRPVNTEVVPLSDEDRLLLGKLIFEECVEYLTKGLGLAVVDEDFGHPIARFDLQDRMGLVIDEEAKYDPIESADGLGDMNVVIHFNAHWHGFNLDAITEEIHDSNMSKLDENGEPIINRCDVYDCDVVNCNPEHLLDPTRPVGKILKGPNFRKPNLQAVLDRGNN